MRHVLTAAVIAVPAFLVAADAPSLVANLKVHVDQGPPVRIEVTASVQAPDNAIMNVSLKTERADLRGKHWKLVDMKKAMVKDGTLSIAFAPTALPFGPYKVEVDCDRNRQYPDVQLPAGSFQATEGFKVDFTEDIAAPTAPLVEGFEAVAAALAELDEAHKANEGKAGDAKRAEEFEKFRQAWLEKLMKITQKSAVEGEDLLYQDTRNALNGVVSKLQLFADLYTSELKGEKNETHEAHPNWFEPAPAADLAEARKVLAREFAFNAGRKLDFAYEKCTDVIKAAKEGPGAVRTWETFRTRFAKDLERMATAYQALSTGSLKGEIQLIASEAPQLFAAGQDILAAAEQEMNGKSGAFNKAKDNLMRAYQNNRQRIANSEKKQP